MLAAGRNPVWWKQYLIDLVTESAFARCNYDDDGKEEAVRETGVGTSFFGLGGKKLESCRILGLGFS